MRLPMLKEWVVIFRKLPVTHRINSLVAKTIATINATSEIAVVRSSEAHIIINAINTMMNVRFRIWIAHRSFNSGDRISTFEMDRWSVHRKISASGITMAEAIIFATVVPLWRSCKNVLMYSGKVDYPEKVELNNKLLFYLYFFRKYCMLWFTLWKIFFDCSFLDWVMMKI